MSAFTCSSGVRGGVTATQGCNCKWSLNTLILVVEKTFQIKFFSISQKNSLREYHMDEFYQFFQQSMSDFDTREAAEISSQTSLSILIRCYFIVKIIPHLFSRAVVTIHWWDRVSLRSWCRGVNRRPGWNHGLLGQLVLGYLLHQDIWCTSLTRRLQKRCNVLINRYRLLFSLFSAEKEWRLALSCNGGFRL